MSILQLNNINNRLSLRQPQRRSLEILSRVSEIIKFDKNADQYEQLRIIQSEYPQVKAFDRDFLSFCFALATGVGKTRLMGAFIAYLFLEHGIRNFFVIAPNLTIYNKLIADFTPNTPKYVFKGIGEFARIPPLIVTGDNYESGIGVRNASGQQNLPESFFDPIHINIFNIAKITARDNKKTKLAEDDKQRNLPRFRRLREELGESYFDYLANLDDLVVLMDESHRYRADAGMAAINELKPILGLELTATPQVERGNKTEAFTNVIYSYPLSEAMNDGFVKEPAVATRENFDVSQYTSDSLERLKLEDGINIHEVTKIELETYGRNNNVPLVKPFMLVVAQDTAHADDLQRLIESDGFKEGNYKGKVIQVHSSLKGDEKDEIIQQLLTVEDPKNPIEIVIHVNMLKEGWDVTNLYTIVPLRAANSKTLVEQSIGRGLRLPYGKRTGEPAVDRLTIVSHDKFQEIIDHANDPTSIIRVGIIIGRDIPVNGKKTVTIPTYLSTFISGSKVEVTDAVGHSEPIATSTNTSPFSPSEQKIAAETLQAISKFSHLNSSIELLTPVVQQEICKTVEESIAAQKQNFDFGDQKPVDIVAVVKKTTEAFHHLTIDIPKIVVIPKGEVLCDYGQFTLDTSRINLQPVSQEILIQHLHDRQRYTLRTGNDFVEEQQLENYIVHGLTSFEDVDYDSNADLLYDLSSQVISRLREYLSNESDIINVLQYHQKTIAEYVHAQMQEHFSNSITEYEAQICKGFYTLDSNNCTIDSSETVRDFHCAIPRGQRDQIRSMLFGGFKKCLYPQQKFDCDSERGFSVILENDSCVKKWFKPSLSDFKIHYNKGEYTPDFVIETADAKLIVETKAEKDIESQDVKEKARAAVHWCQYATQSGGKPWIYLLIPDNKIDESKTFPGLIATFAIAALDQG